MVNDSESAGHHHLFVYGVHAVSLRRGVPYVGPRERDSSSGASLLIRSQAAHGLSAPSGKEGEGAGNAANPVGRRQRRPGQARVYGRLLAGVRPMTG